MPKKKKTFKSIYTSFKTQSTKLTIKTEDHTIRAIRMKRNNRKCENTTESSAQKLVFYLSFAFTRLIANSFFITGSLKSVFFHSAPS